MPVKAPRPFHPRFKYIFQDSKISEVCISSQHGSSCSNVMKEISIWRQNGLLGWSHRLEGYFTFFQTGHLELRLPSLLPRCADCLKATHVFQQEIVDMFGCTLRENNLIPKFTSWTLNQQAKHLVGEKLNWISPSSIIFSSYFRGNSPSKQSVALLCRMKTGMCPRPPALHFPWPCPPLHIDLNGECNNHLSMLGS